MRFFFQDQFAHMLNLIRIFNSNTIIFENKYIVYEKLTIKY